MLLRLPSKVLIVSIILVLAALGTPQALAGSLPLGDAAGYGVLYEGTGGHNLSISNVTVDGNVGVGGTGKVQFSGPGTITGQLDFSASAAVSVHEPRVTSVQG
jgi:hypothetical protein